MTERCNTWPETSTPLLDEIDKRLGVDWEHVPCTGMGYTDKLRTLFAANDLPDVFETYWIEEIIRQGTAGRQRRRSSETHADVLEGTFDVCQ